MKAVHECEPASFLMVAVPAYTGQVAVETMASLMAGCVRLTKLGVRVGLTYLTGCCYLEYARNYLITQFLESPATDILLVDSDVGFEPDAMVRIAQTRRPFVAGVYPLKVDGDHWPLWFDTDVIVADTDGLVEVPSVPGGFLRLNRMVFDLLDHEDFSCATIDSELVLKGYFRASLRDGQYIDSDVEMCRRWLALGGRIHMIPDLTFQHIGRKVWTGNWANSTRKEA